MQQPVSKGVLQHKQNQYSLFNIARPKEFNKSVLWESKQYMYKDTSNLISMLCNFFVKANRFGNYFRTLEGPLQILIQYFISEKQLSRKAKILTNLQKHLVFVRIWKKCGTLNAILFGLFMNDNGADINLDKRSGLEIQEQVYCCGNKLWEKKRLFCYIAGFNLERKQDTNYTLFPKRPLSRKCPNCSEHKATYKPVETKIGDFLIMQVDCGTFLPNFNEQFFGSDYVLEAAIDYEENEMYRCYYHNNNKWFKVLNECDREQLDMQNMFCYRFLLYAKKPPENIRHITLKGSQALFDAFFACLVHSNQSALLKSCENVLAAVGRAIPAPDNPSEYLEFLQKARDVLGNEFIANETPYEFLRCLQTFAHGRAEPQYGAQRVNFISFMKRPQSALINVAIVDNKQIGVQLSRNCSTSAIHQDLYMGETYKNFFSQLSSIYDLESDRRPEINFQNCLKHQKGPKSEKTCISYKLQGAATWQNFEFETGSLLLVEIGEVKTKRLQGCKCYLSEIENLYTDKKCELEGVIAGTTQEVTAYFKVREKWYYLDNNCTRLRKVEQLPDHIDNVWILVYEIEKSTTQPEKTIVREVTHSISYSGLPNLGETCYMNAVLNCLFFSQRFMEWLPGHCNQHPTVMGSLLSNFCRQYNHGHSQNSISKLLSDIVSEVDMGNVSNCSNTFLHNVCDKLKRPSPFEYTFKSDYKCISCGKSQTRANDFAYYFEVKLKGRQSFQENLSNELQEYSCDYPGCTHNKGMKKVKLLSLGSIFAICLRPEGSKFDNSHAQHFYPDILDMKQFYDFGKQYRLYAIIHRITDGVEHVVAEVRKDGKRLLFDDDKPVTELNPDDRTPGHAYMLFYEQKEEIDYISVVGIVLANIQPVMNFFVETNNVTPGSVTECMKTFMIQYENGSKTNPIRHAQLQNKNLAEMLEIILKEIDNENQDIDPFEEQMHKYQQVLAVYRVSKCVKLHRILSLVTESVFICKKCKSPHDAPYFKYNRILQLTIPTAFFNTDTKNSMTIFENQGYFSPKTYEMYNQHSKKEYSIDAMKAQITHREIIFSTSLDIADTVDLETCIKYQFRFQPCEIKDCSMCNRCSLHFQQDFLRHVEKVLVISLNHNQKMRRNKVHIPVELDVGHFTEIEIEMRYRIVIVVEEGYEEGCLVWKYDGENWLAVDEKGEKKVRQFRNPNEYASLLVYQKVND